MVLVLETAIVATFLLLLLFIGAYVRRISSIFLFFLEYVLFYCLT